MNLGGHEIQLMTMTRKSFITLLAKERGNWHSYVAGRGMDRDGFFEE